MPGDELAAAPASASLAHSRDALTPQEYREEHRSVADIRLVSAGVQMQLLGDPGRARYRLDCLVEAQGECATAEWAFDIPTERGEPVADARAWDADGSLQSRVTQVEGEGTRLRVRLRVPLGRGEQYRFGYEYETSIRSIVTRGGVSQTVALGDWVIFSLRCDLLRVSVLLPPGATLLGTVPAAHSQSSAAVRYEIRGLRSLEALQYLVVYRKKKVGAPFYRWMASAVGSGLIGALIAAALGGML